MKGCPAPYTGRLGLRRQNIHLDGGIIGRDIGHVLVRQLFCYDVHALVLTSLGLVLGKGLDEIALDLAREVRGLRVFGKAVQPMAGLTGGDLLAPSLGIPCACGAWCNDPPA